MVTQALAPLPITWAKPDPRPFDLTVTGGASQLSHQFDDLSQGGGAERLTLGQKPARGIDRQASADRRVATGEDAGLVTLGAQPELGPGQQFAGRIGVLALDDVDVVGSESGRRVGIVGGQCRWWGDGDVVDPAQR